jgi:hypothetical protein
LSSHPNIMSNVCHSVTGDCRTMAPRISTMSEPGGECVIEKGKIGDLGSEVFVTPDNVVYYHNGVTVREFNHAGLRLPQKRTFLGPEFYDSGCATMYGNSRFNPGEPSSAQSDSAATEAMFNYVFAPQPYFEGNNVDCTTALSKCQGPNSALGWMMDSNGQLLWKKNVQSEKSNSKCGASM